MNAGVICIIFSSYRIRLQLLLIDWFLVICRMFFVCTYWYMGQYSANDVFLFNFICCTLHMSVWPALVCGTGLM